MPRKISKVAILGGGLMGSGIATAMILSNYPVVLKEVNEKFLNAGIDRIVFFKSQNTYSIWQYSMMGILIIFVECVMVDSLDDVYSQIFIFI